MPDLRVRVDEWVLPSHTQAARVAEGSLDLAIAWIKGAELERHNLAAHLLWYERLEAVMPRSHPATRQTSVPAADVTVLIDVDEASWMSWNHYASAFAAATEASVVHIDDGGIAGACVLRPRGPPASPGTRFTQAPHGADASDVDPPARPVPVPIWAWVLLHRADDKRPLVARATRA